MNGSRTSCDQPTTKIASGVERGDGRDGLGRIDVGRLDELGSKPGGDVVE